MTENSFTGIFDVVRSPRSLTFLSFPFLGIPAKDTNPASLALLFICVLYEMGGRRESTHTQKSHGSENVHLLIRILNCKNVLLLQKLLQFDWEVGRGGEGIRSTRQIPK